MTGIPVSNFRDLPDKMTKRMPESRSENTNIKYMSYFKKMGKMYFTFWLCGEVVLYVTELMDTFFSVTLFQQRSTALNGLLGSGGFQILQISHLYKAHWIMQKKNILNP